MHIHNHNLENSSKLVKRASYMAVSAAAIIIIAKLIGWFITDSLSILDSLFDSLLDIAASLVNLVAIHYALQPADNEHRFGHGKAEDLAVLTQSLFFSISGIIVVITAIKKLFYTEEIHEGKIGIFLMLFSIVITIILVSYQKYVISQTRSNIVKADNFHYLIDLLTNIATIIALIFATYLNWHIADPLFAIGIACYILYGAWSLLKKAFDNLMDRELSYDEKNVIKQIISANNKIKGFHDLKTRYSGNKPFIQFHLVLDAKMNLSDTHLIVQEIESAIHMKMPHAEIIIHQDPDGIDEDIEYKD